MSEYVPLNIFSSKDGGLDGRLSVRRLRRCTAVKESPPDDNQVESAVIGTSGKWGRLA